MSSAADLVFMPVSEQAALIRARKLSPVELTDAYLARIEALNPKLNAFITVTADRARADARAAEQAIAKGQYRGPLHGIPYAPKDILATHGHPHHQRVESDRQLGSRLRVHDHRTAGRRRGRPCSANSNLLEFAMGSGVVSGFGPARNPWDPARTPSGSSSGSGAALAAHMVPLSIGTDTGGSIRGPAAFCGIVGLKQTYGRVSRYGVTTLAWTLRSRGADDAHRRRRGRDAAGHCRRRSDGT